MGLGDLRHRSTMILKVKVYINGHESGGKPRRGTQQLVNEFHQLAAKNLNVNAVQRSIASVSWYSIQGKKKLLYSLFDRPKSGFVRPKKYLAGHHDWRPTVRYFEPWRLQSALHTLGLPARDYACHSFRRGGASFAFQAGLPVGLIKILRDLMFSQVWVLDNDGCLLKTP